MTWQETLLTFAAAVGITAATMALLRPLFLRVGLVDQPDMRKRHGSPVAISGGPAIAIVMVAAFVIGHAPSSWWLALVAAVILLVIGLLDDCFGMPIAVRLLGQVAAAFTLVTAGFRVEDLGALGSLGPFAMPFSMLCIVTFINACNMVDGADGLIGGALLPGALVLALFDTAFGGRVALVLGGGLVGFLLWNWPAASASRRVGLRMFLGNGGVKFVALLLAAVLLANVGRGGHLTPGVVPWLVLIPLADLANSCVRRLIRRASPLEADRGHFHHRLIAAGWSNRAVASAYLAVAAVAATVAALAVLLHVGDSLLWGSAAILLSGATIFGLAPDGEPGAVAHADVARPGSSPTTDP